MLLRLRTVEFGALFSEGIEPEPVPAPATRRLRRQAAFREDITVKARRVLRVLQHFIRPRRVVDLPATFSLLLRVRRSRPGRLPDPRDALASVDGLAGLAFDLAPASMIEAYGKGLSPCASLGPIAWHCRPHRFVAPPAAIAGACDLRTEGADPGWTLSFDRDVEGVLARSGRPRDRAPIMPARLLGGFAELFDAGFAHSFEVRDRQGKTIGGGFGVAVGGVFTIEGAFEITSGAARIGLAHLARRLGDWNFTLVECAPGAAWIASGVFRPMPREEYLALLAQHMAEEKIGRWRDDEAVKTPIVPQLHRRAA
jgi:leucyl/phenylalanyl-tRNA--protein transferase